MLFYQTRKYAAALRRMLIQDIDEYKRGVIQEEYTSPEYKAMVEAEYYAGLPLSRFTRWAVQRYQIARTHYWRETNQKI
jgi:hypothetical protein